MEPFTAEAHLQSPFHSFMVSRLRAAVHVEGNRTDVGQSAGLGTVPGLSGDVMISWTFIFRSPVCCCLVLDGSISKAVVSRGGADVAQ